MGKYLRKILFLASDGFTLVEVLLAVVISTILFAAMLIATMEGHRASTGIEQKVSTQQDLRAALSVMAAEIQMASYNPPVGDTYNNAIWMTTSCAPCSGTACLNKGIPDASATSLTVEMDLNGNKTIGGADPNEIITYAYDAANQQITRTVNCNVVAGVGFLGGPTSESNRQRNVLVRNTTPLFRYFDGSNTEIPPASFPARLPEIQRIQITLDVLAADPDYQGQRREIIESINVIPRNHMQPK
jgi:prepilin-type N-terminal cleavage/methylation domain-containing protein